MGLIAFLVLAFIAVAAALGLVFSRNAVHSALFMFLNFVTLAVFYVILNAQFLAVAQVIVYVGAVVVMFLFVVMLIGAGGDVSDVKASTRTWAPLLGIVLVLALLGILGYVSISGKMSSFQGMFTEKYLAKIGATQALSGVLFTRYLLPFEIASLLLLVGVIGAVVLARSREE
jgi:NADH-quinone oxidoreductase subunit J